MPWGSGGVRSWAPSCHPADQVLLLGWLDGSHSEGAEQGRAGRGCCLAGTLILVTMPAVHLQVPQCMARRGWGQRLPAIPNGGCSAGPNGQGAVVALGHNHASCQGSPSSPLQDTKKPAAHWPCSAPSIPGDGFSQEQSITWLSAPVGSVYTSSSNYHLFKPSRKENKLLYREGKVPSL